MAMIYSVPLSKIIRDFKLEVVHMPQDGDLIQISSSDINRPGLQLSGFFQFFDDKRLQLLGRSEFAYMNQFPLKEYEMAVDGFFALNPPAVIVTRGLDIPDLVYQSAVRHGVALLRTDEPTSQFMSGLVSFLGIELAPRETRHGVLVEVYGEGILILGESGVGKSETAIELVKRGHRLIADDAVEIRRISNNTLVGTAPENIRHFMELRGIGIINVRKLFGIGAVKVTGKLGLVAKLEPWDSEKVYDRMGLDNEYMNILGLDIPMITIPVQPGRNLAIIVEIAAMNNREKKLGYNAAHELLRRLGMEDQVDDTYVDWETYWMEEALLYHFIADTHTHTLACGHAYSTLLENVAAAGKRRFSFLAFTEHAPAMPDSTAEWFFNNLWVIPDEMEGVVVLKGCEANIMNEQADLDLPDATLSYLDWVIASLHGPCFSGKKGEDCTEVYCRLAKNPHVDVIGHSGNPQYPYDYEKGVKTFKEYGKFVELNNASLVSRPGSRSGCAQIAKLCMQYGVPVVVSSDAHFAWSVGDFSRIEEMLLELQFPRDLILNCDRDWFAQVAYEKTQGRIDKRIV